MLRCEPGACEPTARKLHPAVGHVLAAEYAKTQHFPGRQLRAELGMEIASRRRGELIAIALLHLVVDGDGALCHAKAPFNAATWPSPRRGARAGSARCSRWAARGP